jgi:DNA-binding response OmpR family regulator
MAKVLVVDDDPNVLRLLSVILRYEGFGVDTAEDGLRALDLVTQEAPDLIILDLNMPVMDGREFYGAVRRCGYSGPVMINSAYGATAARIELGAEAAMDKPFDPDDLVALVRTMVEPGGSSLAGT